MQQREGKEINQHHSMHGVQAADIGKSFGQLMSLPLLHCFAKRTAEWVMSISVTPELPSLSFIEVQYTMVSDRIQVPAVTPSEKRLLRQKG
jgi:hypothetical protein